MVAGPVAEAERDEPAAGPAGIDPKLRRGDLIALALAVVLVVAVPFVAGTPLLVAGIFAGMFALAAIGLQLLMGLAGQVSLGQAGFFAIAGYTSAILVVRNDWPAVAAAAVAVVLAMAAAVVVGLPLLRLKGHFLALATLGFGIIVAVVANEWRFTGATTGVFGVPRPTIGPLEFRTHQQFFWLVWPLVLVAVVLARNIVASRVGRALAAVHDSEVAAQTLGIDTFRLRLQVFVLSAAFAAVGGSLYAHWVGVVNPGAASFLLSIRFIIMSVVGGLSTVWGGVIGAVFIEWLGETLEEWIPRLVPGATGEAQLIGFGVVLVAVLILVPGGLAEIGQRIARRLPRRGPAREGRGGHEAGASAVPESARESEPSSGAEPTTVEPLLPRDGRPEPGTPMLEVSGLRKSFGGVHAVDGVDLTAATGEIVAVIGPNGAGKTTLFNVVTGIQAPTAGQVRVGGLRVDGAPPHRIGRARAARTFQNLEIFGSMTVVANIMVGRHERSRGGLLAGALVLPARRHERAIVEDARRLLDLVGLSDVAATPAADLPFGRQRLLEVARALATEPDLLLLDEPMAGLSAAERADLALLLRRLRAGGMAILLVEHDIAAVMALADRVAVLDDGRRIAYGPPAQVRNDPAVIEAYLGADVDADSLGGPT